MSWYYTDEGVSNYYLMKKREKELAKMRKAKKILKEKRKKERAKILKKMKKDQEKEALKELKIQQRKERLEMKKKTLKENGWKSGYVRQNVLVRNNKAKDLGLCKEIYEKAKSGMTTRELSLQYNRPNNWVLRYKYEYEAYLQALAQKGEINES